MVESVRACTRCGTTSELIVSSLAVSEGPLQDAFPELNLCPWCTQSFTRWMERRHRHSRSSSERSHSHDADEPMPRDPEFKIADPSPESRLEDGKGSPDESGESPHSLTESSGRRRRRRRSSASSSVSPSGDTSVKERMVKWLSHPAFLYASLFIAAAIVMFLLLKMIQTAPIEPEIPD